MRIARDLLGKILVTRFGNDRTSGRIVEAEAYGGEPDQASHAFGGRRTRRTEVMYQAGGTAYVYLCYGMHHLFNVVTNMKGIPHAILIRAIEPMEGISTMLARAGKEELTPSLTRGPGNVGRALGLDRIHSGHSLLGEEIFIEDDGYRVRKADLGVSVRIGVQYAGKDAQLPYRFFIRGNRYVSGNRGVNPGKP